MSNLVRPAPFPPTSVGRQPSAGAAPRGAVHLLLGASSGNALLASAALPWLLLGLAAADAATLACCVLPNRFDWLLRAAAPVAPRVAVVKLTSRRGARRAGLEDDLWLEGFSRRSVDAAELAATVRRIVEAPVVCGQVERVEDWPYQLSRL